MFLKDYDGSLKMCLHRPERVPHERATILPTGRIQDNMKLLLTVIFFSDIIV